MPKRASSDVLDNGLDYPRARAAAGDTITLHVIKAYSAGDSYATVVGNSIGSAVLDATDLVLANNSTTGRKVTVASKSITAGASSGSGPDLHFAIVNTTASTVLVVTDETSDQVVTSGNTMTTGTWAFKFDYAAG